MQSVVRTVWEILGEGSFTESWLTWPHSAAVPCLTPLHPTLPPLTDTEFLHGSQKKHPKNYTLLCIWFLAVFFFFFK